MAERTAATIALPFALDSGEQSVSASIGISVASRSDETPESLLRDADAAMYRAKKAGGGRYELFDDEMRAKVVGRLRIEKELRHALDHGELRVHYQPVVDTVSGLPRGTEALVRWQHPEWGLVAPLDFIPIAEETGLIVDDRGRRDRQPHRTAAEDLGTRSDGERSHPRGRSEGYLFSHPRPADDIDPFLEQLLRPLITARSVQPPM
jgi:predicted signal transduction protein with EAL and GGDEF domain